MIYKEKYITMGKNILILERSSQNLKKISQDGKIVLEGVFAEFGVENRNGRVYEEKEYLPHLEYLKKDIAQGNLLGELDHPERFEVALGNVSHRISDLWYDQKNRQIKGRIEILGGTPKGQIAKSLLEAGIPLSISSRAAGTVNDDKTVSIQQIYTYDLVAKPGFESAQLNSINESARSKISGLVQKLNESHNKFEQDNQNIASELGIINENISIYNVDDKFPQINLREEAIALNVKNKNEINQMNQNEFSEKSVQQWTVFVKNEISKINERLDTIEGSVIENEGENISTIKKYVEKLRKIQEGSLDWQGDIAKAVNKLGKYSDKLAEKNNEHYDLTKKIVKTIDHNAKTINFMQDWTEKVAKVTNATAETVDHNAKMTNGLNEWVTEVAQGVNKLNEWGEEKAKAINGMHEWTSSIAKNLNHSSNWTESMFGKSVSKKDATKLVKYIELIGEGKKDPNMKKKLDEALSSNEIKGSISEGIFPEVTSVSRTKNIQITDAGKDSKVFPKAITSVSRTGNVKVNTDAGKDSSVTFDGKIITAKIKKSKTGGSLPKGLKVIDNSNGKSTKGGGKIRGIMVLDTTKSTPGKGSVATPASGDGPTAKHTKDQNLKLKAVKENKNELKFDLSSIIKIKETKLDEKLGKIIKGLEKEKVKINESVQAFPFVSLLNETDKKSFSDLSQSEKEKVSKVIEKNPTNDSETVKKLWNSALTEGVVETPLFITAAPEKYKALYKTANEKIKSAIEARSEFFILETQYQINNFWETSELAERTKTLNEIFTAKQEGKSEEVDDNYDTVVNTIGKMMERYN